MRIIDADTAKKAVHEEFDECLVWDESGEHTANIIEEILEALPTIDAIPVAYIESEKKRVNVMVVEEAITGNKKEAERLSVIAMVMDAIISNWRYTTGNDWRAENAV